MRCPASATEIATQVRALVGLVERHHQTPMVARTLTQSALPSTIGARMAAWLTGVLDAADTVASLPALPVQAGGAAGTLAATTELTGSPQAALELSDALAAALGLAPAAPWHTTRSVVTRTGDAFVTCCDAWGHIANDVATGSRAEIGELAEGRGGGVIDHAAQEQPGDVDTDPTGRAHRAASGRSPALRVGGRVSTSGPTAAGTPSGPPCAP